MGIKKYQYYFRKPKSEITKDVLTWIAIAGSIVVAASSPYFIRNITKAVERRKKYPKKKIVYTFYNLKRQGLIKFRMENHQISISLTKKGKKKAGWMQIDSLRIHCQRKWDGWWRLVIFDIAHIKKISREALRGKLKQLGFYPFQKSIWVHAFDCRPEIELLIDFFGFSEKEIRLIVAKDIGEEGDLKKFFHIVR